jgi:hypothetical protein
MNLRFSGGRRHLHRSSVLRNFRGDWRGQIVDRLVLIVARLCLAAQRNVGIILHVNRRVMLMLLRMMISVAWLWLISDLVIWSTVFGNGLANSVPRSVDSRIVVIVVMTVRCRDFIVNLAETLSMLIPMVKRFWRGLWW